MVLRTVFSFLLAFSAMTMSGCGYHLGAQKPSTWKHVNTIAVPLFANSTQEPRITAILTTSLVKRLQMDGTYQIADVDTADAVLKCRIITVNRYQARTVATDTIRSRELKVLVKVEYELIDSATGMSLTKSTASGDTNIILGQNFQLSERQAISDTADRIALQICSRIADGW